MFETTFPDYLEVGLNDYFSGPGLRYDASLLSFNNSGDTFEVNSFTIVTASFTKNDVDFDMFSFDLEYM